MLKLAYQYILYYKSQALAILASIILTAALLSGMSSLMYSSTCNNLENKKAMYGLWHYSISMDKDKDISKFYNKKENEFSIVQYGKMEIVDRIEEPYLIYFLKTDNVYRKLTHREIVKGNYPEKSNEIAMDRYTLGNLGFSEHIGDSFYLNGKNYILSGIIESIWAEDTDVMEIFVGDDFNKNIGEKEKLSFFYLQFDEKKPLYKQLDAFLKKYHLSSDCVKENQEVTAYLYGEKPDSIYDIIKFALTNKNGNFTYIILKLQQEYQLSFYGMIFFLCFFSLFVIYSVFNISVSKRISEYGIMQTLGISETQIGITLVLELWLLFLIGYPMGCFLGNGILNLFYQKLQLIFSMKTNVTNQMEIEISYLDQVFVQDKIGTAKFYIAWHVIFFGFIFLLLSFLLIAFLVVHILRKQSVYQAMKEDYFLKKGRKIYSKRHFYLADIVTRKFLFSNKKKVIGILLSLSIGSCIFLCTIYLVENLKVHTEMSMKADDGLNSDYKISIKSKKMSDTIPVDVVDTIKKIKELSEAYAMKYILGEITIQKEELEWEEYFDEQNKDPYYQQNFGGICVKKKDGTYGIKYDIYGYDDGMIEKLSEFLLEGDLKKEELKQGNKIIAVANVDAQGNYNFYGKHPGDKITLKVPKDLNCDKEILKFQSKETNYVEKEFEIAAILSRSLTKEDNFLVVAPWNDAPSLIMTNQEMEKQYGIKNYRLFHISTSKKEMIDNIRNRLLNEIHDIPKAVLQGHTTEMEIKKNQLLQQELFFFAIAGILLVISLFHIINSMTYSIFSHRREYSIMRAMGITDIGFYKMIIKAGILYGLLTDIFIFLLYHMILRRGMNYYMVHIVQFLHIKTEVPSLIMIMLMILNLLITVISVVIPARQVVKSNIISEISA